LKFPQNFNFLLSNRKVALLLFAAVFTSAKAQNSSSFNCTFSVNFFDEYVCTLVDIEVLDPLQNVTFGGEHLANRTNQDVGAVRIRNSNTPFMIQQIFATFPNVFELDIQDSRLESINIPNSIQLEVLVLTNNNISRIVNGTFSGQSRLTFLNAVNAGIQVIEDDAFLGLESLVSLVLIRNNVSELSSNTLAPLINARRIDFERNSLTRIGDIFANSANLTNLYLEFNQINEISPRVLSGIGNSLSTFNLRGNQCIDRYFTFDEEIELILFNNLLSSCFINFNGGEVSETRRIILEFQGPLALFDEFGNIIARVN
jgi:BspA type Leucine rich repeat region (6 copies)